VNPPPRWREEPLASACDQILAAARRAGKMCAVFCVSPQMGVDMKKKGHDLIVAGMDAVILRQHSQEKVDFLRNA
jgi:2-keto-3-deoxy-L-rhamnonate aldolase RhmA